MRFVFVDDAFWGNGSNGPLVVPGGTTTYLELDTMYQYSSIDISGTLRFNGENGAVFLKCSGDCSITGTIELRGIITQAGGITRETVQHTLSSSTEVRGDTAETGVDGVNGWRNSNGTPGSLGGYVRGGCGGNGGRGSDGDSPYTNGGNGANGADGSGTTGATCLQLHVGGDLTLNGTIMAKGGTDGGDGGDGGSGRGGDVVIYYRSTFTGSLDNIQNQGNGNAGTLGPGAAENSNPPTLGPGIDGAAGSPGTGGIDGLKICEQVGVSDYAEPYEPGVF